MISPLIRTLMLHFELVWNLFRAYHARAFCPQSNAPLHLHCDLLCLSQYSPQSTITVASKIGQTRPDVFEGENQKQEELIVQAEADTVLATVSPESGGPAWGGVVVLAVGAMKP